LPVSAPVGSIGASLSVDLEQGPAQLRRAVAAGRVKAEGVAIVPRGRREPFIRIPALAVGLKEVDALASRVALSSVEAGGVELTATRSAGGDIDVLALLRSPSVASAPGAGEPGASPSSPSAIAPASPGPSPPERTP